MSIRRRSKNNDKYMEEITTKPTKFKNGRKFWKYNPNCKYIEVVRAIEKEKRLNGENLEV